MNESKPFDLFVFHRHPAADNAALNGGAAGVVVDLETLGKADRQSGFDTQINQHSWEDLRAVGQDLLAYTICRINAIGEHSATEVHRVLELGVDEVLLPMVRSIAEVEQLLKLVNGRAHVGVMIETLEAVAIASELDRLPVTRVYVGLNDLMICRGSQSIFSAMADGTVDSIREQIHNSLFGFGGLTIPGAGSPLPVEHFANEMTRLDCQFSFLRRSFFQATIELDVQDAIGQIQAMLHTSRSRDRQTMIRDGQITKRQLDSILEPCESTA